MIRNAKILKEHKYKYYNSYFTLSVEQYEQDQVDEILCLLADEYYCDNGIKQKL